VLAHARSLADACLYYSVEIAVGYASLLTRSLAVSARFRQRRLAAVTLYTEEIIY